LCRRFAAALTGDRARLEVDVDRYSFIVSDLHRLLIAGLPAPCERFWTLAEPRRCAAKMRGLRPPICWSLSSWILRYLFVDHTVPATWRSLAATRLSAD